MERPDLNKMWETFIKFSWNDIQSGRHIETIRKQLCPVISRLKKEDVISWYCFLIHDRRSGVPTSEDDKEPYFHLRFAVQKDIDPRGFLHEYCVLTRKVKPEWVARISISENEFIDTSLFKRERIEEAWRILGEQSEWLLNMLSIFKDEVGIPLRYIGLFLHYYANMTQLRIG